jgi:hypothetical protein
MLLLDLTKIIDDEELYFFDLLYFIFHSNKSSGKSTTIHDQRGALDLAKLS